MKFASFVLSVFLLAFFVTSSSFAKTESVRLLTNAHCEGCKAKIEKALKKVEGVESASLDLPSKVVEVKFNPEKTNLDALINSIKKAGYDAAIYTENSQINLPEHKDKDCKDKTDKHNCHDNKSSKNPENKNR